MKYFISQLRCRQEQELIRLEASTENSFKRWQGAVAIVESSLAAIKEFFQNYEYSNLEEEIDFFKNILPDFLSELIFYTNLLRIERKMPEGGISVIKKYYERELASITRYYKQHQDFYEYYRTNAVYLDDKYFLRGGRTPSLVTDPYFLILDQSICTSGSLIISTILAYQQLKQYLIEQLNGLVTRTKLVDSTDYGIKWTDTRAALEEMVYAWYFKGSFNNGQVELKKLYEYVAYRLGVQPGNIYKSKQDFYGRSNLSAYIDLLRKRYREGMEDTDDRFGQK